MVPRDQITNFLNLSFRKKATKSAYTIFEPNSLRITPLQEKARECARIAFRGTDFTCHFQSSHYREDASKKRITILNVLQLVGDETI
jgi:hypothetical protein